MINHIRTLLVNCPGVSPYNDPEFGGEYIPPTYIPRCVDATLSRFRQTLFGASPDLVVVNFRTYQAMQLLHHSELAPVLPAFDSRITYLPMTRRATCFLPATCLPAWANVLADLVAFGDKEQDIFLADNLICTTLRRVHKRHRITVEKAAAVLLAAAIYTEALPEETQ